MNTITIKRLLRNYMEYTWEDYSTMYYKVCKLRGRDIATKLVMARAIRMMSTAERVRLFDKRYDTLEQVSPKQVAIISSGELRYKSLKGLVHKMPTKDLFIVYGDHPTDFKNLDAYMAFKYYLNSPRENDNVLLNRWVEKYGARVVNDLHDIDKLKKMSVTLPKALSNRPAPLVIRMYTDGSYHIVTCPEEFGVVKSLSLYNTNYLFNLRVKPSTLWYQCTRVLLPAAGSQRVREEVVWRPIKCIHKHWSANKDRPETIVYLKKYPTVAQVEAFYANNPWAQLVVYVPIIKERTVYDVTNQCLKTIKERKYVPQDTFLTVEDLYKGEDIEENGIDTDSIDSAIDIISQRDIEGDALHDLLIGNTAMMESYLLQNGYYEEDTKSELQQEFEIILEDYTYVYGLDDFDALLEALRNDPRIEDLKQRFNI